MWTTVFKIVAVVALYEFFIKKKDCGCPGGTKPIVFENGAVIRPTNGKGLIDGYFKG